MRAKWTDERIAGFSKPIPKAECKSYLGWIFGVMLAVIVIIKYIF